MGCRPHFSNEPTAWQSAFGGPQQAFQTGTAVIAIDNLVDPKLATVFSDLRRLAELINTHTGDDVQLNGAMFQSVLVSIQRRLLWLRYESEEGWSECLRLGMLALLTTTFQLPGRKIAYDNLATQYRTACRGVKTSTPTTQTLLLWVLMIGAVSVFDPEEQWLRAKWKKAAASEGSWVELKQRLQSVIWLNGIHDEPGRCACLSLAR